jgi:two-component system LytT family response regulator
MNGVPVDHAPAGRLRVVIAEDEPLARRALRRMLAQDAQVALVAELEDIPSLSAWLRRDATHADVLFLDVQMPGGSVFDLWPLLPAGLSVVFTTAHAQHAATAFDLDAVDFLRKPFGGRRVHDALERVRRRQQEVTMQLSTGAHVVVRVGVRDVPVRVAGVWRFEGADDHVRVVTPERVLLHDCTLASLEQQLAASHFLRVHRRHLVNTQAIRALVSHDPHRLAVEFPDGSRIVASRRGSAALRIWLRASGLANAMPVQEERAAPPA